MKRFTDHPTVPGRAASGRRGAASIRDVAARAGVSIATVSNVLAGKASVNPALAARVRAAVQELGYVVNRAAAQLRLGHSQVVAVVVPSLENPFFTSIIAAIERHVRRDGYEIIVGSSGDDERVEATRLGALLAWRPRGVVVVPCTDGFGSRALLTDAGVPYVVADRVVEGFSGVDAVTVDNEAAGVAAAEHLVALGHRELVVVASSLELANIRQRCAGIQRVLSRASLAAPEVLEVGFTLEDVARRFEGWIAGRRAPTAVIALTNFSTLGVMAALTQRGLGVPGAVSLVGFDDYVWMRAATPPITAVRQPVDRIGAEAVKRLRARIGGDRGAPRHIRLACELVERASVRRVGAAELRPRRRPMS